MNSFGTGSLATLACVRVAKVELARVGTKDCDIRLLESECFPLLHKETFQIWLEANGHTGSAQDEITKLVEELYPKDAFLEDQIPFGFKLLCRLLSMKSEDLFGSLWRGENEGKDTSFKKFLGSGAFSCVFEGPEENSVIKISCLG